eukprot:1134217-Amphidinium_carterae.1
MPNGAKTQTPSAAAASPVPNLNFSNFSRSGGADGSTQPRTGRRQGYESFGEQTNNSQIPPVKPQRPRRSGGDFPGQGDDDDDDEPEDDDEGYGPYDHPYATVHG